MPARCDLAVPGAGTPIATILERPVVVPMNPRQAADAPNAAVRQAPEDSESEIAHHVELNAALREVARERDAALRQATAERQRLYEVLIQSPALVAILRGPDHVYELVNDAFVQS